MDRLPPQPDATTADRERREALARWELIERRRALIAGSGLFDAELTAYIHKVVDRKEARHHIGEPGFQKPSRSMVHIGG